MKTDQVGTHKGKKFSQMVKADISTGNQGENNKD